ncbi:MAG: transcriptional regulator NanR [Mesorhizobium sp.]
MYLTFQFNRNSVLSDWYNRYTSVIGIQIKQRKLSDEVAGHLERLICDGELKEADRLPSERELMRQYGVGRPSIREALVRLSKMGLVEVRSGERARVTRPTPQFVIDALAGPARHMIAAPGGVQDFQNARIFFEIGLARNAAEHATKEDIEAFAEALEANRQSLGDLKRFERTDVEFHYVLALMMRNSIFTAIHAALAEWLLEQRRTTLAAAPGEAEEAYKAHKRIFTAIAARDPEQSERAMRDHLEHVARRYANVMEAAR